MPWETPLGQNCFVRAPLTVAVVQPACIAGDTTANGRVHAEAVRAAQARVVVFPELSLTGYELEADAVALSDDALTPIVRACAKADSVALVGAPILDDRGRAFIAILRIGAFGVEVVYRKMWLGGAEPARFSPGEEPAVLEIDGWRLGLGICKDTGVAEQIRRTGTLGIDAYLAGVVHHAEELSMQEARGVSIARQCRAYVAFASFAGPTGGGYSVTAGSSAIWSPEGIVLARAGADIGSMARASLL